MAPKPVIGVKPYIDARDYNCVLDAQRISDATIAAGSLGDLTSTSGLFKASDVGKVVGIRKAGAIDAGKTIPKTHVTTIATYVSPSHVTLTVPALNAVSGEYAAWGSDDTTPWINALAAASAARKPIRFLGASLTTAQLTWPNYCTLIGEGGGGRSGQAAIVPVGSGFSGLRYDGQSGPALLAPILKSFEVDANGLCESTYTTTTKGIYFSNLQDALFEDLWVHHSPASAIGCDFWVNGAIVNCWADYGGRQVDELGASGGGSGLGIGTGKYLDESLEIIGGGAISTGGAGSGLYGLFLENQTTPNPLPRGFRVVGFVARGYKYGLSDNGNEGALFDGCQAFACTIAGFKVTKAFTNRYGRDTQLTGCISMFNAMGLSIDTTVGQLKWDGGQIGWNTGDGIQLSDTGTGANATPYPTQIRIRNADVFQNSGFGARVLGGTFDRLSFEGGHYWNNGVSNASQNAAIRVARPVNKLRVSGITAFDDRAAGSQTQSYGLDTTGATITELVYGGCDFRGNATGKDLIPVGTVTTQTAILGGNL